MRHARRYVNFNSRPSARGDKRRSCPRTRKPTLFQFTPLREGRPKITWQDWQNEPFQFTPLREGRQGVGVAKVAVIAISIHAPPRGATLRCRAHARRFPYFNSRPSARGDGVKIEFEGRTYTFQFTPLREGRPAQQTADRAELKISIHAPPRGATFCGFPTTFALQISIHAPPRGATPSADQMTSTISHFNSRPSARGDRLNPPPPRAAAPLFQFTPLREGRPNMLLRLQNTQGHFNSRPSARGDKFPASTCAKGIFQFTPLREGRPN